MAVHKVTNINCKIICLHAPNLPANKYHSVRECIVNSNTVWDANSENLTSTCNKMDCVYSETVLYVAE